jgi:CheY-like chemotaxis protein
MPSCSKPQSLDRASGGLGLEPAAPASITAARSSSNFPPWKRAARQWRTGNPGRADAPADGPKTRVLVVDDNEDSANMLRDALVRRGHAVEVAVDGPSALARAVIFRPDTVLLDIGLPMMDGYEVTRRLRSVRAQEGASPPRPFAVTGYGQDADRQRAVEAGSSDAW